MVDQFRPYVYSDSDLAAILEAASVALEAEKRPELIARLNTAARLYAVERRHANDSPYWRKVAGNKEWLRRHPPRHGRPHDVPVNRLIAELIHIWSEFFERIPVLTVVDETHLPSDFLRFLIACLKPLGVRMQLTTIRERARSLARRAARDEGAGKRQTVR